MDAADPQAGICVGQILSGLFRHAGLGAQQKEGHSRRGHMAQDALGKVDAGDLGLQGRAQELCGIDNAHTVGNRQVGAVENAPERLVILGREDKLGVGSDNIVETGLREKRNAGLHCLIQGEVVDPHPQNVTFQGDTSQVRVKLY